MKMLPALAGTLCLLFAASPTAARTYQPTSAHHASARTAICKTFGRYCSQALRVSWCESRWSIYARNGQYLGLFQMGSYARSRYGHGSDAWTQARAAYAYFRDSGWSPWQCLPGGGLRW